MKLFFFPKLAMDGIRKNKRMYVSYIFTGSLMVMIYYILNSLMKNPALEQMLIWRNLSAVTYQFRYPDTAYAAG